MAHGSWLPAHGSWLMAGTCSRKDLESQGPSTGLATRFFLVHEVCITTYLRAMSHEPWTVKQGSCFANCESFTYQMISSWEIVFSMSFESESVEDWIACIRMVSGRLFGAPEAFQKLLRPIRIDEERKPKKISVSACQVFLGPDPGANGSGGRWGGMG